MNKTTRTSQATRNTHNSDFNTETPQWSASGSSEEEDIEMLQGRRKSNPENKTNK